jgi:hypothetical protein
MRDMEYIVEQLKAVAGRIDHIAQEVERGEPLNYPEADFLIGQAVAFALVAGYDEYADQMVMLREQLLR